MHVWHGVDCPESKIAMGWRMTHQPYTAGQPTNNAVIENSAAWTYKPRLPLTKNTKSDHEQHVYFFFSPCKLIPHPALLRICSII